MDSNIFCELNEGIRTAFIDSGSPSNLAYRPEFVTNDYKNGIKVLSHIDRELRNCEEFYISVAFISKSGYLILSQTLQELALRGIKGKILTTDYLTFTDPEALDRIASFGNIELKIYKTSHENIGFHTKGYIFKNKNILRMIIGSSNMTQTALSTNLEWNTKLISTTTGEVAETIMREFNQLWMDKAAKTYEEFIDKYRHEFERHKLLKKLEEEQHRIAQDEKRIDFEVHQLKPNMMQQEFICNVHSLIEQGGKKGLLISATGTGKTYASAFALRNENPKRALFIVHRELIAKQAMESYRKVLGKDKKLSLLSGNSKDYSGDIIFATMNMMAKDEVLNKFNRDEFDWICIDEVHRAGALSYSKIMSYFEPKFWLGMTASPERTDGIDIFEIFDHNVVFEIRLQDALEEDLLCPFHYFGVTDIIVEENDKLVGINKKDFSYLVPEERVNHIIKTAELYVQCDDRVKGIVFCSRKEEARLLSEAFNQRGYFTTVLTGEHSEKQRELSIELLTKEVEFSKIKVHRRNIKKHNRIIEEDFPFLDYIFTIDIFNEGVDIPEINQVLMLRQTESPIVFIQQLGRGLRKSKGKEYVSVIDFIGNYENNYMIPIALSGDRSYNKDTMRRFVTEGTRLIPGASTVSFDAISKQIIYQSIDSAKTNDVSLLKSSFNQLRFRLGRIPEISDFKKYGSIDIRKYINRFGSYHSFLTKYYSNEYSIVLNDYELNIIEFISQKLTNMKRKEDLVLVKKLLDSDDRAKIYGYAILEKIISKKLKYLILDSVYRNLTNTFPKSVDQPKFKDSILVERSGEEIFLNQRFQKVLIENSDFEKMVRELIEYGLDIYQENYSNHYKETNFQLYQKYTYEDVCRLLNWKQNQTAQNIGGYFYDKETKTLPVFINYDKGENDIAYEDRFIDRDRVIALSKAPRKVTSSDADHFYKRTPNDIDNKIYLFVRKNKDDKEAKEFYFLGEIFAEGEPYPIVMNDGRNAFEINYHLDVPVREDIYEYIISEG